VVCLPTAGPIETTGIVSLVGYGKRITPPYSPCKGAAAGNESLAALKPRTARLCLARIKPELESRGDLGKDEKEGRPQPELGGNTAILVGYTSRTKFKRNLARIILGGREKGEEGTGAGRGS